MKFNFLLILVVAAILGSCQKDKTDYQALSQDAALSQSMSSDVFKNVDNEAKNGDYHSSVGKKESTYQSHATCATVTFKTSGGSFPDTLIIDFGTSGCTDAYLTTRKGKLICAFTGLYKTQGTVITVATDNYYVNGYKVDGVKTITNMGRNASSQMYFHVVDANGTITKPDGKVTTWTSDYNQTWIAGESTDFWQVGLSGICDDTYAATGSISGVGSAGDTYEFRSTAPIIKNVCCYWIQQGTFDIYVNSSKIATFDYGTGNCDGIAVLNYKNKNYTISMY